MLGIFVNLIEPRLAMNLPLVQCEACLRPGLRPASAPAFALLSDMRLIIMSERKPVSHINHQNSSDFFSLEARLSDCLSNRLPSCC